MNIIELAKQADLSAMTADGHCREDYWTATRQELERFANLVLEEAAVECDKRKHAGDAGALMAARAIRALKGANE